MADRTTRLLLDDTDIKRNLAEITARVDQLAKSFNGVASSFAAAVSQVSTQNKFVQGVQAQSQFLKTGVAPDASSDRASDLASSQAAATVRVAEAQKLVNDQIAKRGVASQTALKALDTEQSGYAAIVDKLKSINLETSSRISLNTRLKLQQDEQFASTTKQLALIRAGQQQDLQQTLLNDTIFQAKARDIRAQNLANRAGDQGDDRFQALQLQLAAAQAEARQVFQKAQLGNAGFQDNARDLRAGALNNRIEDQQDPRFQDANRQLAVGRAQTSLGNAQDPELIALKAQKDVLTDIASLEAKIAATRGSASLASDAGDKLKAFQEELKQARLEVDLAQTRLKAGQGTELDVTGAKDSYTQLYQVGQSMKETAAFAKQVEQAEAAIAATAAKLAVEQEKGNVAAVTRLEMKRAEQALDLIALSDISRSTSEYADQLAIVKQLAAAQQAASSPQAKDAARVAELNRQASAQGDEVRAAQSQLNRVNTKANVLGDGGAFLLQLQAQFSVNNAVLNTFQTIVGSVATYVTTLDKSLYDLKAIAGLTNAEMNGLAATLVAVSEHSKFTAVDLAKSATDLAQAGFSGKQIQESIGSIAQLATATGNELSKTTDIVSTTLNIFNLRATDTKNVVNTLTSALNLTKLDLERLGLGLQYAGESAANSGISFEELTASIGAFANAGARSGSTIGTGLRSLITELSAPTAKLQLEFERLGITTEDINLKSQGLTGVLQNLSDKGFVASAAFEALDRRSVNAFLSVSSQLGTINDLTKAFSFSTAAADGAADANESLANKLSRTTGIFGNLATSLLNGPLKTFKVFIDTLGSVGVALNGSGKGFQVLGDLLTAIPIAAVGGLLFNLARGFIASGVAAEGAAVGVRILSVALLTNPFVLIGAAVAAVTIGFTLFGNSADAAADRLEKTKGRVSAAADALTETKQTAQGISEAMAQLSNRTTVLEKDSDLLQSTIDGLNNKFGNLGLNLDRNETKVLNVVTALGKLKASFDALSVDDVQRSISAQIAQQTQDKQISLNAPGSKNFGPGSNSIFSSFSDDRPSLGLSVNKYGDNRGKISGFAGDPGFNAAIQSANNPANFDVSNTDAASKRIADLNAADKLASDSLAKLADGIGVFANLSDDQRKSLAKIIEEAQNTNQAQIDRINLYRKQAASIKAAQDILPDLEFQKVNSETASALVAKFKEQHEALDKKLADLPATDIDGREVVLGQLKDLVSGLNKSVNDTFGMSIVDLQKKYRGATLTTDFAQAQGEVNIQVQTAQDAINKSLLTLLGLSTKRYAAQIAKIKEETTNRTPVGLIPGREAQALTDFDSSAADEKSRAVIELNQRGNFAKAKSSEPDGIYEKSLQAVDEEAAANRSKLKDYFDKITANIKDGAGDLKSGVAEVMAALKKSLGDAALAVKHADDDHKNYQDELKDVSRPEYKDQYGSSREIALKLQGPAQETKRNSAIVAAITPTVQDGGSLDVAKNALLADRLELQEKLKANGVIIDNIDTDNEVSVKGVNALTAEQAKLVAQINADNQKIAGVDAQRAKSNETLNTTLQRQKQIDEDRPGQSGGLDVSKGFSDGVADYNEKIKDSRSTTQQFANDTTQVLEGTQAAFSSFFDKIATGTATVGDAFKSLATDILKSMLQVVESEASKQLLKLVVSLGSSLLGGSVGGGGAPAGDTFIGDGTGGFMQGGIIRAAAGYVPSPNRDSVNILAQPGEAILRKSAVDLLGTGTVNSLNAMGNSTISANDSSSSSDSSSSTPTTVNVWIVPAGTQPSMGANDVLAVVQNDIQRNGATAKLIKSITVGDAT